jgi:hypothetical protein
MAVCTHPDQIKLTKPPGPVEGCEECLATRGTSCGIAVPLALAPLLATTTGSTSTNRATGLNQRPHRRDHLPPPGVEAWVVTFGEAACPPSSADRYEQPEQPHLMMWGGSSCSRTFSSSVRPSVWSAPRVSSGRRRGSLDQAVPLISTTTCATCAPRVISQRQPCASTPARTYLPRFALISQLTTARLGERARRVHLGPKTSPQPTSK